MENSLSFSTAELTLVRGIPQILERVFDLRIHFIFLRIKKRWVLRVFDEPPEKNLFEAVLKNWVRFKNDKFLN